MYMGRFGKMDYSLNSFSNDLYRYTGVLEECNVVHKDKQSKQQDVPLILKFQQVIDSLSETLRLLKAQLKHLTKWETATEMDRIACNFVKRPGQEWVFSGPAQIYIGSYKLESDYSWICVQSTVYA